MERKAQKAIRGARVRGAQWDPKGREAMMDFQVKRETKGFRAFKGYKAPKENRDFQDLATKT
jgi:hypothetical protein